MTRVYRSFEGDCKSGESSLVIAIAAIGGGSLVLSSFFFGLRLIWKSYQTRGLPEFCLGMGLFLMGGLGYSISTAANAIPDVPESFRLAASFISMICSIAGHSVIALFTYKVFRPGVAWARLLAGSIFGVLSVLMVWQLISPGLEVQLGQANGPWQFSTHLTLVNLLWTTFESLSYYAKLRKRRRLGLADPWIANQVLMWAIAIGSAATVVVTMMFLKAIGVPTTGKEGLVTTALIVGPMGPISAVCMGLAFMPPSWYRRWLTHRAAMLQPA